MPNRLLTPHEVYEQLRRGFQTDMTLDDPLDGAQTTTLPGCCSTIVVHDLPTDAALEDLLDLDENYDEDSKEIVDEDELKVVLRKRIRELTLLNEDDEQACGLMALSENQQLVQIAARRAGWKAIAGYPGSDGHVTIYVKGMRPKR